MYSFKSFHKKSEQYNLFQVVLNLVFNDAVFLFSLKAFMNAFKWALLHTVVLVLIFDAVLVYCSSATSSFSLPFYIMFACSSSIISCLPSFIFPASSSADQWNFSPQLTFLYSSNRFTANRKVCDCPES